MGIEAVGSAVASVASAIGRGASSIGKVSGEMPSAGMLSGFGPKLEGPLTSIVNEGPVGFADLKNTMPLKLGQINPVSEFRFDNPVKRAVSLEPLSVESAITEAESIISQARINHVPEPVVTEVEAVREAVYWLDTVKQVAEPKPFEIVQPHVQAVIKEAEAVAQKAWESHPITQAEQQIVQKLNKQALSVLPKPSEKLEEVLVEEKVEQGKPKEFTEEEIELEQKVFLEDEQVSTQRRYEIREATAKARSEADRLGLKTIVGWLVAKFMPAEHEGNRSQVVKRTGPDGSYQETIEAIVSTGGFESEGKAVERFDEIVMERKPVKVGKNGTPVGNEDVARVFKYWTVKPVQAYVEIIRRVIKKSSILSGQSLGVNTIPPLGWTEGWTEVGQAEAKLETNLEDLGLEEIFRG